MIDSVRRRRHSIEVLTHDLAGQDNLVDAKASPADFGGNEVLISFVLLGVADVSDWRLVDITARSGGGILANEDFRAHCIWRWNWKFDFVADRDVTSEKARQQKLRFISKDADSAAVLPLDAYHALATDRNSRIGRRRSHTAR